MSKPMLCLFVRNELAGCRASVPLINKTLFSEVFAIDAFSKDGTREYLEEQGFRVVAQKHSGYSGAYIDAFEETKGKDLIVYHPKGTVDPGCLADISNELGQGKDLVVASRMMDGGKNADDLGIIRHRKYFGLLAGFVLWIRFSKERVKPRILDPLHGVRGLSKELISRSSLIEGNVVSDLELIKVAYTNGMQVSEVPVVEGNRIAGRTNFPTLKTGVHLAKFLLFAK